MTKAVLTADEEERGLHPCLLIEGADQIGEESEVEGRKSPRLALELHKVASICLFLEVS